MNFKLNIFFSHITSNHFLMPSGPFTYVRRPFPVLGDHFRLFGDISVSTEIIWYVRRLSPRVPGTSGQHQ